MDLLDNVINKRLIGGSFPTDTIYTVDDYVPCACNLKVLAENGINVLRQYPSHMYGLFTTFENRVKEIEVLDRPEVFEQEANILINTGYDVDSFNVTGKFYQEASKLCAAVTAVDKILWYGAWGYYFTNDIMPNNEHYKEYMNMMYAWIYLLKVVQRKEIEYGLAINVKSITSKTNIIKLIEADWDKVDKKYFSKLTEYGKKRLSEVEEATAHISHKIEVDNTSQKEIADRTSAEWGIFIDIINSLSQKEYDVIRRINQAGSPKDKLRIINEYNSVIDGIGHVKYVIDGKEINLLSLFEIISERMQNASVYCVVKTNGSRHFRLHPAAFMLAMDPKTYNYLFLSFHQFRLNP